MLPKTNQTYTLTEILTQLELRDMPCLRFFHKGIVGCIQDSHVTDDELKSVPGMSDSKWVYLFTTHEWIPVFIFNDHINQPSIETLVDLEKSNGLYKGDDDPPSWWATPKGFPRKQYDDET